MSTLLLFCALIVAGAVVIALASQADRRLDDDIRDALGEPPSNVRVLRDRDAS